MADPTRRDARSPSRRLIFLVASAAVLAPGCSGCEHKAPAPPAVPANPCAGDGSASFEYREQAGALLLQLRPATAAAATGTKDAAPALCDGKARLVGRLERDPQGFTIRDAAGKVVASATRAKDGRWTLASGTDSLRLVGHGDLVRLLDEKNVPHGQVGRLKDRGIAFTAGGKPLATAERESVGKPRLLLRAPDGTVTHFVTGLRTERAAAAFAVDGLSVPERFLLAQVLDDTK